MDYMFQKDKNTPVRYSQCFIYHVYKIPPNMIATEHGDN